MNSSGTAPLPQMQELVTDGLITWTRSRSSLSQAITSKEGCVSRRSRLAAPWAAVTLLARSLGTWLVMLFDVS